MCSFLVEGLESDAVLTRQGCCRALSLLQVSTRIQFLKQLILWTSIIVLLSFVAEYKRVSDLGRVSVCIMFNVVYF